MGEEAKCLIIDLSEDCISLALAQDYYNTDINCLDFIEDPKSTVEKFTEFCKEADLSDIKDIIFTLPIKHLNYQVVTLPENIPNKDKLILLGLELNTNKLSRNFNYLKLSVTHRIEENEELCDYMVVGPKSDVYKTLIEFAKLFKYRIVKVVPSFFLVSPEAESKLTATAWVGEDRSEVVIWGKNDPLALSMIPNTGDQMGDINRFIVGYFDHVSNLSLSHIKLYGPKLVDTSLTFGLNYPHSIFDDPVRKLSKSLHKAIDGLNIAQVTRLPKPPVPMTPRNITFISSALVAVLLSIVSSMYHAYNIRLGYELNTLRTKAAKNKRLYLEYQKLDRQKNSLATEKDFYLNITKRRIPWSLILEDLSKLTPVELWFERLSGSQISVQVAGKARTVEDVTALSINLNNNSQYFTDVQIIGTRDSKEGSNVYSEFQISAKLKSRTGQFVSK